MSSVLYSTTCFIKKRLYQLSVDVERASTNAAETETPTVTPSSTRIKLETVSSRTGASNVQIIPLNQLLNVRHTKLPSRRFKRSYNVSTDTLNISNSSQPPSSEPSKQGSSTALNALSIAAAAPPTSAIPRSFSLSRLFFAPSTTDMTTDPAYRPAVEINYIDVSQSIRWSVKRVEVEVESENVADELCASLNLCLSALTQRPRHLLAFVNPYGGKGRAPFIFDKKVRPIFEQANVTVHSIVTERANHARDYILNEDLSEYDGLICVGGDGMFAELCDGLLLRTSREANLDMNDRNTKIIRPELRIGIIPAGSTDAVVFGTTGLNDPITSALQIIVGESLSIDIATVHNENGFVRFLATMLSYGFFGDIIHQSDKWRCLGPLRYDLAGFYQFLLNRSYHSALTITLSSPDSPQLAQAATPGAMSNVADSTRATENKQVDAELRKVARDIIAPGLAFCRRNCETCALVETNETDAARSPKQIHLEGRYTTINCLNMPCRCAKSKFGMSPFVHLGGGTFDLILVKRSWQTGFLRFLWQVANDSRTIADLPNVERYCVSEVLIRPLDADRKSLGNWACDGETISGREIRIRTHRQALNLFASGIQFDRVGTNNPIMRNTTVVP